jgi:hypothetical protein
MLTQQHLKKIKRVFEKRSRNYLWANSKSSSKNKKMLPQYIDELFFFYDSLRRCVWIDKNKRSVIRVTGSHQNSSIFEAKSIEGNQLFRQYDIPNDDTFLEYLKMIHIKFSKCYLFIDKALPPHYESKKVIKFFEKNKDSLNPIYLP